jgi:hypothetical protein
MKSLGVPVESWGRIGNEERFPSPLGQQCGGASVFNELASVVDLAFRQGEMNDVVWALSSVGDSLSRRNDVVGRGDQLVQLASGGSVSKPAEWANVCHKGRRLPFRTVQSVSSAEVTVEEQLRTYALEVDARLDALLPSEQQLPHELAAAMRYACLGPGKRLRPALCLASCEAVEGDRVQAMDASCALEMVHSFSLIHDDLPALDNDDLRRGRPTCHVAFGEAIAILAGDGLFSLAFETLAALGGSVRCVQILSNATGLGGLVADGIAGESGVRNRGGSWWRGRPVDS